MRVVVMAFGSRGDVQPMAALCVALRDAGHSPILVTHENFMAFAEELGLECHPMPVDSRVVVESEAGRRWLGTHGGSFLSTVSFIRQFTALLRPVVVDVTRTVHEVAAGADALVGNGVTYFMGHTVAEALGAPYYMAQLQPGDPTRAYPSTFFSEPPHWLRSGAGTYNLLTHYVSGTLLWSGLRRETNAARRDVLGLAPWPATGPYLALLELGWPSLGAYSAHLAPRPPDVPDTLHVTGAWFLERAADWRPPAALERFLAAGPPPVCVGFGSMLGPDPAATTRAVVEALDRTGQRAVLLSGWGGLTGQDLPDSVLHLERAPHDWLFPRCAAVVHHAGAGTTAAALRAGVPAVAVPVFADQPFWAARLHAAGVAPPPLPFPDLTADRLAESIAAAVTDPGLRARAAELGERVRAEHGTGQAVRVIEEHVARRAAAGA